MGDDGVGIRVVRILQARLEPQRQDVVFKELSVSGIRLIEEILGFDRVIIVDSHTGEDTEVGRIRRFTPADFSDTFHPGTPHGLNFATALELYKNIDREHIPKTIEIYTIDINPEFVFGDKLSPTIEKASDELTDLLIRELSSTGTAT